MARLVAIEWDMQELRLASGSKQGGRVAIDHLLSMPLTQDGTAATPENVDEFVASALAKLVQKAGVARSETLIAAGRGLVELRSLTLPPASDDELPDMVRFAAQRTFAQLGDTWPLDFIKLPGVTDAGQQVLASAMNPALISKIKKSVELSLLDPKKILLRPMASAALANAVHSSLNNSSAIIVSVVGEEVDLLVSQNGTITLIRTSRLPQGDHSVREKAIIAEIKRTWMASESQVPAVQPTQLVIWGDLGIGPALGTSLTEKTGLPTTVLSLKNAADIRSSVPSGDLEKFVPVVGMIHQVSHGQHNFIDFLSPRKPTEKKKPILQIALASTVAALLLFYGAFSYYSTHKDLDSEIANLKRELKGQEKLVATSQRKSAEWEKVAKFLRSDIVWLDQLAYLSEQALPADSMVLTGQNVFSINSQTGAATMTANVAAIEQEMLTEVEENLRDNEHTVTGSRAGMNKDTKSNYPYVSTITVEVPPATPQKLAEQLRKPARLIPEKEDHSESTTSHAEKKDAARSPANSEGAAS